MIHLASMYAIHYFYRAEYSNYFMQKIKSRVQRQSEKMMDRHGFIGVPRETFEQAGRNQFVTLLEQGLLPESKVLDIGCGVLRLAYWLVRFLDPGCYCGIEPAQDRVDYGKEYIITPTQLEEKKPRFDYNENFDTSVFDEKFDFFIAGSIWTHCSKEHILTMLDGFLRNTRPNAQFLVSYLPASDPSEDYQGSQWVGTSHKSNVAGCIKHDRNWINEVCTQRGLTVEDLPHRAFDSQFWLKIAFE